MRKGYRLTEEHKAKIAASLIGNQRAKGYHPTDERRIKMAEVMMGNTYAKGEHTQEHNAKIAATLLGNQRSLKHGHTKHGHVTPEYNTWRAMKKRCADPNNKDWANYGGNGITVCDSWIDSFENFLADMGDRPEGKTLDRINNNLGYYKENCRWATAKEQAQNRRDRL